MKFASYKNLNSDQDYRSQKSFLKVTYQAVHVCSQPESLARCKSLAKLQQLELAEVINQLLTERAAPSEQNYSPNATFRLVPENMKLTRG